MFLRYIGRSAAVGYLIFSVGGFQRVPHVVRGNRQYFKCFRGFVQLAFDSDFVKVFFDALAGINGFPFTAVNTVQAVKHHVHFIIGEISLEKRNALYDHKNK